MAHTGSTPVSPAAAASASPFEAVGLEAAPGVGLVEGTTSEPTPAGAPASTGTLPAEAFSSGGGYTAGSVDLLGLDLESPAPSGPPPPAGHDRGVCHTRRPFRQVVCLRAVCHAPGRCHQGALAGGLRQFEGGYG